MKRILIVEDDADIAAIERDYLELGGYAVTIAPDGTTGLDTPLPPLGITTFHPVAFFLGVWTLLTLEALKQKMERKEKEV